MYNQSFINKYIYIYICEPLGLGRFATLRDGSVQRASS